MQGWIKLHRKIVNHWVYQKPEYLHAWITIIMTVNHEKKRSLIHGEIIECDRGQSILSLHSWALLFGRKWTIQKVRTFFDLLKNDAMINTEGLRKTTRLTVCNYDNYQDAQQTNNTQITFKQHTDNTQVTTTKECKNEKKSNNGVDWKKDFDVYRDDLKRSFVQIMNDSKWIKEQERLNPKLDIKLSIEKACVNYWSTEEAWATKKKKPIKTINWKSTIANSITFHKVYKNEN